MNVEGMKKEEEKIESNSSFSLYADTKDLFYTRSLKPVAMTEI